MAEAMYAEWEMMLGKVYIDQIRTDAKKYK